MPDNGKVVINLSTGLEDPERVFVALLVGGAALQKGKQVAMFLTKEAVRLAVPGVAVGVVCEDCPPIPTLFDQYAEGGGELFVCPFCFDARKLDKDALVNNATIAGASPLFEWMGEGASVFSY